MPRYIPATPNIIQDLTSLARRQQRVEQQGLRKLLVDGAETSYTTSTDMTTTPPLTTGQAAQQNPLRMQTTAVLTSETTTSTTFVNLATVGPAITFIAPLSGVVTALWSFWGSNAAGSTTSSVVAGPQLLAADGTTSVVAAADDRSATVANGVSGNQSGSGQFEYASLTPGSQYTIRLQYRNGSGGGTALFLRRYLTVIPSP